MKISETHKEIHSKLMRRKNPTLLWGSPFDNAWVGFVLCDHKAKDEKILNEILDFFNRWIRSSTDPFREERNIGAVSLYVGIASILKNYEGLKQIQMLIKKKITELDKKEKGKFSMFNSPEIFYATVTGLQMSGILKKDKDLKKILFDYVRKEFNRNWNKNIYRFALFSAAFFELGDLSRNKKIITFISSVDIKELDPDETIPLLWFLTKYNENIICITKNNTIQRMIEEKRERLWKQFENQMIYFSYDIEVPPEESMGSVYFLSTFELAMIDDIFACMEKTYKVEPNEVFDLLDIHPIIKDASEKLFKDGHYPQAIFEAYKALINYVKEKSGETILDGKKLMGKVFSFKREKETLEITKKPVLQLNELRSREDLDEQEGFMHLFMGSVLGIRNPKAHGIIKQKDPFKTLEYLSLASLLAKRIDEAKVNK